MSTNPHDKAIDAISAVFDWLIDHQADYTPDQFQDRKRIVTCLVYEIEAAYEKACN